MIWRWGKWRYMPDGLDWEPQAGPPRRVAAQHQGYPRPLKHQYEHVAHGFPHGHLAERGAPRGQVGMAGPRWPRAGAASRGGSAAGQFGGIRGARQGVRVIPV